MSNATVVTNTQSHSSAVTGFLNDMMAGLSNRPRYVPPKHFYDATGSALFDRICALPEYYLTRTEMEILRTHAAGMAQIIGPNAEIIEFGAGSLTKIRVLFDALGTENAPSQFLPIDISGEHLDRAVAGLRTQYPHLAIRPIIADYTESLHLPAAGVSTRRVGFFPGSTIGNFETEDALAFLRSAAQVLQGGGLLIGVDLSKSPECLHAAYNDSQGVTAAFNLNLLRRANKELDANFDLDAFSHYAYFNPVQHRIEMHLISQRHQHIYLGGERFILEEGASIHTENSYKYTVERFHNLARLAGFVPGHVWMDERRQFSIHWLEAHKRSHV